jgi:hypothetical protein
MRVGQCNQFLPPHHQPPLPRGDARVLRAPSMSPGATLAVRNPPRTHAFTSRLLVVIGRVDIL